MEPQDESPPSKSFILKQLQTFPYLVCALHTLALCGEGPPVLSERILEMHVQCRTRSRHLGTFLRSILFTLLLLAFAIPTLILAGSLQVAKCGTRQRDCEAASRMVGGK